MIKTPLQRLMLSLLRDYSAAKVEQLVDAAVNPFSRPPGRPVGKSTTKLAEELAARLLKNPEEA